MIEQREDLTLTDEVERIDLTAAARLLRQAYWAAERSDAQVAESIRHSTCLALCKGERLIGLVRALSDHSVNSYICDFIIDPEFRHAGLGRWMFETLLRHPDIARTQKLLLTRDARTFYEQYGFEIHPFDCLRLRP